MVLPHSGNVKELLEIETKDFILKFHGESIHHKAKVLNVNMNIPARVFVNSKYDEVKLRTLTDFGNLVLNSGNTMMPCFYEDGSYQIVFQMKEINRYEIYHSEENITKNFTVINNDILLGFISFSSDIGYTNISVFKENKKVLTLTIEVFPSKLDYLKDYKEMINEINEEISSLAFKFFDITYLQTKLKETYYQTNVEFLSILGYIFDDFINILGRIEEKFRFNIVSCEQIKRIDRAKRFSNKTRFYLRSHPNLLVESDNGFISIDKTKYIPAKVIEKKKVTTIDIFENRYVKYMIQRIICRLTLIEEILSKEHKKDQYANYIDFIKEKRKKLEYHLRRYFHNISDLTGNKSMSLVFQMAPGYKDIYKKYVMLNKGLELGEDLFKITPKKLYSLYEAWCYIKIHKILTDLGYEVEEYGILQYKDNGLHLTLLQDSEAKMVYTNSKNKLELWYNKSYSLPTTNQRPDTVLHIRNITGEHKRTYIFDAKYRVSIDNNGVVGPMEEDINVMHRYRDAIVSKVSDDFKYKYETFGAYVMFPYGDEKKFKEHKFYKSIAEVNVGAFPMLPGSTKLITEHLEKIVNQSSLETKSERIIVDEYDDYAKFKLENVMIVNVKDKDHLKAYKDHKFYHIPLKRLSDVRLGVEYLAFYQSKKSFGEEGGIRYFGKIANVVRYERGECKELPARKGTEKDVYLRFNLESIQEVGPIKPIQSGPQLISYTTLYLLKNAENMHELKLKSNLEIEVYKRLKSISKSKGYVIRKVNDNYFINGNIVEIIEGKVIKVNGQITNLKGLENLID